MIGFCKRSMRWTSTVLLLLVPACGGESGDGPTAPPAPLAACELTAPAQIRYAHVPPIGSSEKVRGEVGFLRTPCDPARYRVALYILVPGFSFICKPFQDSPLTKIDRTGAWEAEYDTGGVDEQATEIWAFLVSSSFEWPCFASSLPAVDGETVLASVVAHR